MLGLITVVLALAAAAHGALVSVPDFGANPSGLKMSIYVPSKLSSSPAIILAVSN